MQWLAKIGLWLTACGSGLQARTLVTLQNYCFQNLKTKFFCFVVEQKLILSFFLAIQSEKCKIQLKIWQRADMHTALQFLTKDPFFLLETKDLLKNFILNILFYILQLYDFKS